MAAPPKGIDSKDIEVVLDEDAGSENSLGKDTELHSGIENPEIAQSQLMGEFAATKQDDDTPIQNQRTTSGDVYQVLSPEHKDKKPDELGIAEDPNADEIKQKSFDFPPEALTADLLVTDSQELDETVDLGSSLKVHGDSGNQDVVILSKESNAKPLPEVGDLLGEFLEADASKTIEKPCEMESQLSEFSIGGPSLATDQQLFKPEQPEDSNTTKIQEVLDQEAKSKPEEVEGSSISVVPSEKSQDLGEYLLTMQDVQDTGDLKSEEIEEPVLEIGDLLGDFLDEEKEVDTSIALEEPNAMERQLAEISEEVTGHPVLTSDPQLEVAKATEIQEESEQKAMCQVISFEPEEQTAGLLVTELEDSHKWAEELPTKGNENSPNGFGSLEGQIGARPLPEVGDLLGDFVDEKELDTVGTIVTPQVMVCGFAEISQEVAGLPSLTTAEEIFKSKQLEDSITAKVQEESDKEAVLESVEFEPERAHTAVLSVADSERYKDLGESMKTGEEAVEERSVQDVSKESDKPDLEIGDLLGGFLGETADSVARYPRMVTDPQPLELEQPSDGLHPPHVVTQDISKDPGLAKEVADRAEKVTMGELAEVIGGSEMSEMSEKSQTVVGRGDKSEDSGDHHQQMSSDEDLARKSDEGNLLEGWPEGHNAGNEVENQETEEATIELLQETPVYPNKSDERTTETGSDPCQSKGLTESCNTLVQLGGTVDTDEKQLLIFNENNGRTSEIKLSDDLMQLEDPYSSEQESKSQNSLLDPIFRKEAGADLGKSLRLEETVRGEDAEKITTPATSSHVSAQIRQIVTKHLSTEDLTEVGTSKHQVQILKDENHTLQRELERIEDLLATTRAEREEILIKYNALSERLDQLLQQHSNEDVIDDEATMKTLLNQNMDLRRRLDEERTNFLKKVQTYQDGQRQQANLVQRLQSKVIQYKQKCTDLETSVVSRQRELDQSRSKTDALSGRLADFDSRLTASFNGQIIDLETALIKVEYEQSRCANLIQVNSLLREQLEAATQANQSLASDVQTLTHDWQTMREELELKESEWKEEEQTFNDYFMTEHNRLLSLWRDTVKFRREFGDMKSSTERDLAKLRSDLSTIAKDLKVAYLNLQPTQSFSLPFQQDLVDSAPQNVGLGVDGHSPMTPTELWHRIQELGKAQAEALLERSELLSRIEEIKIQNDQLRSKLDEKEQYIKSLAENVQTMETVKESSETQISTISSLREENTVLLNTLKDIAKRMIWNSDQDRDHDEIDGSQSFASSGMSRIIGGSFSVDATISAIQSALGKRQVEVEELTTKLTTTKDQLNNARKQYDDCIEHRKQLDKQMQQLKSQLDQSFREKNDMVRENERIKLKLESVDREKEQLDRIRQSLASQVAELNSDNENLRREMLEMQKNQDGLHDEQENLRLEKNKHKREIEIGQKTISTLETKLTSIKEELIITKESLSKLTLSRDVLQQEKNELESILKQTEKRHRALEVESSKLRAAESSLRDVLAKLHGDSEVLGLEKAELATYVKKLTEEKINLSAELAEADQEKAGLREEVLRLEQEKMALAEDKNVLQEALATAERSHESLQNESDQHGREKRELSSQLAIENRKRAALAEEVFRLTQEIERRSESMDSAGKEKERLTKEKADLAVRLQASEREVRSLSETLATLKADRGALEMSLYEVQQTLAVMSARKEQLEKEKEDLIERKQTLQSRVNQLQKELEKEILEKETMKKSFERRLAVTSEESASKLGQSQMMHKEEIQRLIREKEMMKQSLDSSHRDAIAKLISEQQQTSAKSENKLEAVHRQMENLQRELLEKLSTIEREKEKTTTVARKEKAKLQEQIQFLQQELQKSQASMDKDKRDATARSEQDKTAMADLQLQLRNLKSHLEDSGLTYEKTLKDLKNEIKELHHLRNLNQQEISTLRSKLNMTEEGRETLRKELNETLRSLSDADGTTERLQGEIADLKKQLTEEKHEKAISQKSNEDLGMKLKRLEGEKSDLKRNLEESQRQLSVMESSGVSSSQEIGQLRLTLQEVEKARLDLRKEAQSLRKQVKILEENLQKKNQEINEIQGRLSREEDKDENNRRELFGLKQQLNESEANREVLRKDMASLQRRMSKMEDVHSIRERDLQMALQENQDKVQQLEAHRRHLEGMLNSVNSGSDELKLQLSTAEGKVGALESQLLKLEGAKKDVEHKLTTIYSALRRYIGLRTDGMTSPAGFLSPVKRRRSPIRGSDGIAFGDHSRPLLLERVQSAAEVDPEMVRGVLRDVMQQLISLEKEKDDAISQVHQLKEQIVDVENERDSTREKISQIQNSLGATQQANQNVASQLSSAQQAVVTHQETINRLQKDSKMATETITNYELRIKEVSTENSQNMEKLKKAILNETRLERENAKLRDTVTQLESRTSTGDQAKRSLEVELQRLRMNMTDKDTEHQVLQARCETLAKQVQELEEKSVSLQITIDRLSLALERSAEDESELKDKLQSLNKSLTESATSGWSLQEKIHHLQKTLANSENERRVYQERCESAKQSLNESKKSNLALSERIQQLRQELSNTEDKCKDFEGQLRSSEKLIGQLKDNDQENLQLIQRLQQEKHSLQTTISELQRSLAQLEIEKHDIQRWQILLEKDKSALKQTLDKVERERLLSTELVSRTSRERTVLDRTFQTLEKENEDLQRRLQAFEVQLAEQEKHHSQQLLNLSSRHRQERDMEIERLKNSHDQAQKTLELRERSHRQRVIGLEQQIQLLKDQLNQEIRKRQLYIQRSAQAGDDMQDLRKALDQSLKNVSRDPTVDSLLLERETQKLDNAVDRHLGLSSPSSALRVRSRTISPVRPNLPGAPQTRGSILTSRGLTGSLQRL